MDKEYEVLDHISKDENITQRKLAQKTGLSLGSANILIKRLVKKGLIKVEQINSRTLKYVLTPAGLIEKTKRTYEYLVYSYNYITGLNKKIKEILLDESNINTIYLLGNKDEVYDIIKNALNEIGTESKDLDRDNVEILIKIDSYVVFVWDFELYIFLRNKGVKCINIFEV